MIGVKAFYIKICTAFTSLFKAAFKTSTLINMGSAKTRLIGLLLLAGIAIIASVGWSGLSSHYATKAYLDMDENELQDNERNEGYKEDSDGHRIIKREGPQEVLIVVDPGHGGEDLGTFYGDMLEKNVNLDISLRLGRLLKDESIRVVYTREKDIFVGLAERASLANELEATLFISVHNNRMPGNPEYKGTETLYATPLNPQYSNMDGRKLAAIVQKELVTTLKTVDNGIIYRPNLAVLRRTKMPAVIAEIGYISNQSDRSRLASADFRYRAALALKNAVAKALEGMGAYRDRDGKWMIN